MNVREKTPDKILVNVEFLKNAISESETEKNTLKEYENSKNMLIALGSALISCLLTLIPSWSKWGIGLKISISLISGSFFIGSLWFLIKLLQTKKVLKKLDYQDLNAHIIDEAKKKIRYTALLIISFQKSKTGEVTFMTEKQGNYLIHCDMDPYKKIEDQKENIINYLATTYNIPKKQIVSIDPLSNEPFFNIKPIHKEETQNGFVFFQIKIKKKAKQDLVNHKDVSWKTIAEMEGMPDLMGRNQDIVMALNEIKTKISDTFEDSYGPLHIIWNITKKCPYNCAFCATKDDSRPELNTVEKLQVLHHIFSAKEYISTLDFAGGDPMYDDGIRTVILNAINSLGEEHVSITTTGKGIQAIGNTAEEDISKLLSRCEITIDASHENLTSKSVQSIFSRKSPEYCNHNFSQIQMASDNLQNLIINIPLIDCTLSDEEVDNLLAKLLKLKQDFSEIHIEAQIIRLMPVGAFGDNDAYNNEYAKYNPLDLAKNLKTRIDNIGIPCRYHCSLRVLPKLGSCDARCNMLTKKLGIDCSGNVFACTWGAYLNMPNKEITQNPFYLGNLVSSNLKSILEGQKSKTPAYKRISREIANQGNKPYCEAISWYFTGNVSENNDPLAKE